jgi:hypothetical protein
VRGRLVALGVLLLAAACASPREREIKAAQKDYQRRNRVTAEFARAQVKQLAAATQTFHAAFNRWPQTFEELMQFVLENKIALDPMAFNDVTFATLSDNSVQIHYDVNCARFNAPPYKFVQTGSLNVKARK